VHGVEGYYGCVQDYGCDSEIVKGEIRGERAFVLSYMYIDNSKQSPHVHAVAVVIRMQDTVFSVRH